MADINAYLHFAEAQLEEYLLLDQDLANMRERIAAVEAGSEQMSATRKMALKQSFQTCTEEAMERGPRVVKRLNWVCIQTDFSAQENTKKIADLKAKLKKAKLKASQLSTLREKATDLLAKYGAAGVQDEEGLRASTESVKFHRSSTVITEMELLSPVPELRGTVVLDPSLNDDLGRVKNEVDEAFERSWRDIR